MSTTPNTVLLVDDDAITLTHFRAVLQHQPDLHVVTARNGVEALAVARAVHPDLIVSDYQMPEMNGFELCQQVRADPEIAGAVFVVLSGFTDTTLKVRGLDLGVDDYLTKPIDVPELVARVRASLRLKRLQDQLREDKQEVEELHDALARSFEQLLSLLIHLIDLGLPGATARGGRLATLARQLAERFEIPKELLTDLDLAAQLHEIGKVVDAAQHHSGQDRQPDWHYAVVSATLLEGVERLKGAAELVGGLYENWDGTGMPAHYVSGQIPLRSRVLRVAVDFLLAIGGEDGGPSRRPAEAIELLRAHQGTWYDPLAISHLESIVLDRPKDEWEATRVHIAAEHLSQGMVLASDLLTSSGVKLLAAGATISEGILEVIRRRHQSDPLIDGAWIRRR